MTRSRLLVTTVSRANEAMRARSSLVARRCDAQSVRRRGSVASLLAEHDADVLYVVGRVRDELMDSTERLAVHAGMLVHKVHSGWNHPLIKAVAPQGELESIVDATLGLAGDALHIAAVTGARVTGIEGSGAMFSLQEEGIARLARGDGDVGSAANRITPTFGQARDRLESMRSNSVEVVYLSPMFAEPRRAAPGYRLLRLVAVGGALDVHTFEQACRVASKRVVIKLNRAEKPGDFVVATDHVQAKASSFWRVDTA